MTVKVQRGVAPKAGPVDVSSAGEASTPVGEPQQVDAKWAPRATKPDRVSVMPVAPKARLARLDQQIASIQASGGIQTRSLPVLQLERARLALQFTTPAQAAADLRDAMFGGLTGIGTDEQKISDTLANRSFDDLQAIRASFLNLTGVTLDEALKSELFWYLPIS